MIPQDPVRILLQTVRLFESEDIEYALYGGLALAVYGRPRETVDVDHVLRQSDLDRAERVLTASSTYVSVPFRRMQYGGLTLTRLTLLTDRRETATVDLVVPPDTSYTERLFSRVYTGTLREQRVRVVSPEDFLVLKVLSTREVDLEDAVSVAENLKDTLDMSLVEREVRVLSEKLADRTPVERYWRLKNGLSQFFDTGLNRGLFP